MITKNKNILILHGWDAVPEDHWFLEAKSKWEKLGYNVFVPKLPGGYFPKKDEWIKVIESFNPDESWILIGHSLGGAAILKYLENAKRPIKKAILVATPYEEMKLGAIESFFGGFDFEKIKQNCSEFEVINEDNDPVVPLEHGKKLSEYLGCQLKIQPGYVHFHTIDLEFLEKLIKE